MIYKAERLYQALGDAKKIFKLVAMLIFDEKKFDKIQKSLSTLKVSDSDDKFVKKRLQLVMRIFIQITNFEDQYNIFSDQF